MVKSKHRSGIRQFIANKPVRFGFKFWVLAESSTGYTLDFNVYTGKFAFTCEIFSMLKHWNWNIKTRLYTSKVILTFIYVGRREQASDFGLAHDVVITLSTILENQGYHLYFDNFFTSPTLVEALYNKGILACGTVSERRRGFPEVLKNTPWRQAQRGKILDKLV